MPRAEFAADSRGNICFGSGYALIPLKGMNEIEIKGWSYILSTEVMEYQYRLVSTNLHSGWFRMYKGHLNKVYLPSIDFSQDELISILTSLQYNSLNSSAWNQLNRYIFKRICFSNKELEYITEYIEKVHKFSISKKVRKELKIK